MNDPYRPRSWGEVVGQPTDRIRALLDGRDTDESFLFHGPPGTGKTTVAHLIGAEVQGSPGEMLVFNASDERGIDTVRESIIPQANQTTLTGAPMVVFLDEMDAMTKDAQEALRAPIERGRAVFILACNDREAVHSAVKSRCQPFHFDALADGDVRHRIRQVADAEGVDLSDDHLKSIVSFANGDMRAAIKRYTQVARGAYDAEVVEPTTDGSLLESSAREYLEGDS